MKLNNLKYHNRSWNSKALIPGIICTLTLLIFGAGMLQSQSLPPGQNGGNVAPCPCDCKIDTSYSGQISFLETCGPECEVKDDPDQSSSRLFYKSVPLTECPSGQKQMKQNTIIKKKTRSTKKKGEYRYPQVRKPPSSNTSADCSSCSACDAVINPVECGAITEECESQDGDNKEEDVGEPEDQGCYTVA
jgi:hypothetical protein